MKFLHYLLNAIDYMYFRVAKVYFKSDGNSAITALLSISLFLTLIILSPVLVIISNTYGQDFIITHKVILSVIAVLLQFTFLFLVSYRYKKVGESLKIKWASEREPAKSIKGVLVVFALLMPFIIIIVDIIIDVK